MAQPPQIPQTWRDLRERLERDSGADRGAGRGPGEPVRGIYVLGAADTGKSTLCRYLVDSLARTAPAGLLDADPGQSSLGPPTTLGLAFAPELDAPAALRFVGSTTPMGHLLQALVGAKRLAEHAAAEGAGWLVIDPPGMVTGETAREFQHQMIDVLGPSWLVVVRDRTATSATPEEAAAIERIVSVFTARQRPKVYRMPVAEAVVPRRAPQRAAYRQARFATYFAAATTRELDLGGRGLHGHLPPGADPADAVGRLAALCDRAGWVVVLGVIEAVDWSAGRLRLHAPPFDEKAVASVEFGSHRMQ